MRALKLTAMILGGLFALLVVVLLAVRFLVSPNDFKGRIVKAVRDSTGRELELPGDIKLSVFPWIALELGPASLGNPPGFDRQPFVAVKHAALHVQLLPLLRKQLRIGRVEIDGLDLRLQKNAHGAGNWEGFGGGAQGQSPPTSPAGESLQDLGGVRIKDSRISYQDLVAEQVNLEVGRVAPLVATPVDLKLRLTLSRGAPPLELSGRFALTPDLAHQKYRILKLELSGSRAAGAGAAALTAKFTAPELNADLQSQTLSAPAFGAQTNGARLSGSLQGAKILDAPSLEGSFKLEPTSPRELMGAAGVAAPKTRDPKALSKLAARGDFSYGDNAAAVSNLDVQLDDSSLRGRLAVTDLKAEAISFELALDRIDFDRYRSPAEPVAKPARPQTSADDAASAQSLKSLRMNGTLTVGTAVAAGMKLTQVNMTVAARDGVTHLAPLRARLYGGDYSGDITLDGRGSVPLLMLDQTLTGVDVAQLLKDLAHSNRVSGRGRVTTHLTARGTGAAAILRSLNGHVTADLENGAIEGLDLWFEINRALALIQKQALPSGQSSGRTRFDTFKASADLANGVAATKDLSIISQNLRIAGQGTADLVSEAINYQVKATVLKQATTGAVAGGNVLADIPVTVTGTLTNPKVSPDLQGLAKARVQQELDKHKDELKQKLQDQLKNLLK